MFFVINLINYVNNKAYLIESIFPQIQRCQTG